MMTGQIKSILAEAIQAGTAVLTGLRDYIPRRVAQAA